MAEGVGDLEKAASKDVDGLRGLNAWRRVEDGGLARAEQAPWGGTGKDSDHSLCAEGALAAACCGPALK
ncbi:MAG: hypothetical protein AAFU79_14235 [Myxococcota bacterium]